MKNNYIGLTLAAGWLAGMRTFSALVFTSSLVRHSSILAPKSKAMKFLGKPAVCTALTILASGEMLGDKLPTTPARIEIGSWTGRTVIGAVAGAVIHRLARQNPYAGVLIGGLSAFAATYAMYALRKEIKRKTGIPDLPVALAEDALVVGTLLSLKKG